MQIQQESKEKHSVVSYSDQTIIIANQELTQSFLVSRDNIINDWPVTHIHQLTAHSLLERFNCLPEIILIGHFESTTAYPNPSLAIDLSNQRIGIEFMDIGAACRTFNVLLSEQRNVILGVIISE